MLTENLFTLLIVALVGLINAIADILPAVYPKAVSSLARYKYCCLALSNCPNGAG